jgi:hypothetical protein
MSEYTREEILKLIEENGGTEGLDLSGKDLSDIDLGCRAIRAELEKTREKAPDETPVWYSEWAGGGVNLKYANLQGACLGSSDLREADLEGANLHGAILGHVNLQGAFLGYADLQGANLISANLQGAILARVDLRGANLVFTNLREVSLSSSHLEKVELVSARSLEGAHFHGAFLDDTRLKKEQLGGAVGEERAGKYDWAKEAYQTLKNNFAEIGRYRDESWAYVKERQMGKMMNHPRLARTYYGKELPENPNAWRLGWFYIRHTRKWATDEFVEQLCEYGESIGRTLRAILVTLIVFGLSFWAIAWMSGEPRPSLMDYITFILGQLTTADVGDLLGPENPWNGLVRLLSAIEAFVGIALTGLLGFVAGNRIRRS